MIDNAAKSQTVERNARTPRTAENEHKLARRRALIAYLVADQGHEESVVGDVLRETYGIGVGRSTISRDLQWAKKNGWVQTRLGESCPGRAWLDEIKQTGHFYRGLQNALKEQSNGTLKSLHVFWGGPIAPRSTGHGSAADLADGHTHNWDARLETFSNRAAPTLLELLGTARRIGVTFGGTIGATIEAIAGAATRARIKPRPDVTLVPTSGEPLGGARPTSASTDLADQLSQILGGPKVPSLRGVPPVIPEEFRGRDHTIVLEFIRRLRSYREVFGDDQTGGLVKQLDTVLTSAGGCGESYHAFQNGFVSLPGHNQERLSEIALGDMGGVMTQKPGLTKAQEKTFAALRDLWTGIGIDDFRRISTAAKANGRPGVILCAVGANKAAITLALTCRENLVNQLIIDETLAARLSESLNLSDRPRPRQKLFLTSKEDSRVREFAP